MEIRHLRILHLDWNVWHIIYGTNSFEDTKPYFSNSLQAYYLKHAQGSCKIYATFYSPFLPIFQTIYKYHCDMIYLRLKTVIL